MSTQDPALAVAFTVTVTMTPDQREAYADARGTGLVELEIATRSPSEFADAIRAIPWVREYATVSVGAAPRQSAVVDAAALRDQLEGLIEGSQQLGNAKAEAGGEQDRRDACENWGRSAAYAHVIELLDAKEAQR